MFDVTRFRVKPGQPVRIDFINPDATAHNLVIVKPGATEEVGLAANEMAKDPESVKSGQFLPNRARSFFTPPCFNRNLPSLYASRLLINLVNIPTFAPFPVTGSS